MRSFVSLVAVAITLAAAINSAHALIFGGGTEPAQDHNWPVGAVQLANMPSRVGWWEGPPFGGGQFMFLYRGDTAAFQTALDALARIEAPAVKLIVDNGPEEDFWLKGADDDGWMDAERKAKAKAKDAHVDWRLEVWDPASWHHLYNNPQSFFDADDPNFRHLVSPPTMTVYVRSDDDAAAGRATVDWATVKVPKNVTVVDRRAAAAGVKLEGGALVRGHVYDMMTSKPIAGVHASLEKLVSQEKYEMVVAVDGDEHGRYEISKIPAGVFRLVISAPDHAPRSITYEQFKPTTFRQFDVVLVPATTVTGTVVDEAGKPIADVQVRADDVMAVDGLGYKLPASVQTKTDKDGRFELAGLPTGYTVLMCFAPNFYYGQINRLTKAPDKDVTLQMSRTGAVRVTLLDSAGKPMAGDVNIQPDATDLPPSRGHVNWWGGGAKIGPDGTYLFENVPAGRYTVSGRGGPDPHAQTITVTAGQTAEVTIRGGGD